MIAVDVVDVVATDSAAQSELYEIEGQSQVEETEGHSPVEKIQDSPSKKASEEKIHYQLMMPS